MAVTRDRRIAGIYCGDLEAAHAAGCRQVAEWTTAPVDGPFDLVVTNGGGFPLDLTFYQSVKGMVTALPAPGPESTLLEASACGEGVGGRECTDPILGYENQWRRFLADIAASSETQLDQWEYQLQARTLQRVGMERLWFVTDGLPEDVRRRLSVTPVLGPGSAEERAQRALDGFLAERPDARVAVIPDGPHTMLRAGTA